MKKFSLALAAIVLVTTLSSCKGGSNSPKIVLNVYNWGEYMDVSLNEEFEKETGIKVNYKTYQTNEMLYSTLKSGGASYDVIIPSDYMVARMIEENMLEPLDFGNIPNAEDVDSQFKGSSYDPGDVYSVPYMWGMVGIIYNKTKVTEPVDSWGILFDEKYASEILMFDNPRDAFAIALSYLGEDFNTADPDKLKAAFDLLQEQRPLVQAYVMDQILEKLPNEEAIVGPYYAGDAISMIDQNPNLEFVVPKEGANLFVDAFCIPKGAKNKEAAEKYIDFMCRTESSLANADEIGYSTPLVSARQELEESGELNPIAYPANEVLARCKVFQNLPKDTRELYDSLWASLKIE